MYVQSKYADSSQGKIVILRGGLLNGVSRELTKARRWDLLCCRDIREKNFSKNCRCYCLIFGPVQTWYICPEIQPQVDSSKFLSSYLELECILNAVTTCDLTSLLYMQIKEWVISVHKDQIMLFIVSVVNVCVRRERGRSQERLSESMHVFFLNERFYPFENNRKPICPMLILCRWPQIISCMGTEKCKKYFWFIMKL